MLLILIVVSLLLGRLEFGLSSSVNLEAAHLGEDKLANEVQESMYRSIVRELNPTTDYHSGIYDPLYHISQQRSLSRKDNNKRTKRVKQMTLDAFVKDRCGNYKQGFLFDRFENTYNCYKEQEDWWNDMAMRKQTSKRGGGKKKMAAKRGNSTRSAGSQRLLIAGGYRVQSGEFPSVVIVRLKTMSGSKSCSGTLIHNNLVLTSANCVMGMQSGVLKFGALRSNAIVQRKSQTRKATKFIVARDYALDNEGKKHFIDPIDLGLIRFEPPVGYSDWVSPICLDSMTRSNIKRRDCIAVGAGEAPETKKYKPIKGLPVLELGCPKSSERFTICYQSVTPLSYPGIPQGEACPADSGSPVICAIKCPGEFKTRQVLQGVLTVSKQGCNTEAVPITYINMHKQKPVLDWMLADIGLIEKEEPTIWWNPTTWG